MSLTRESRILLLVGLALHAAWWSGFLLRTDPLPADAFKQVETWRPRIVETANGFSAEFNIVSHRPTFFIARRPVDGGWNPSKFNAAYMVLNPLGSVPAWRFYKSREQAGHGSSLRNSDMATAILVGGALFQLVAVILFLQGRARARSGLQPVA